MADMLTSFGTPSATKSPSLDFTPPKTPAAAPVPSYLQNQAGPNNPKATVGAAVTNPQPAAPQTVVTSKAATNQIQSAKTTLDQTTQAQQVQAANLANKPPSDPLAQQAGDGSITYQDLLKSNPAAAYYRMWGKAPSPEELTKFQQEQNPKTADQQQGELLNKINGALGETQAPNSNTTNTGLPPEEQKYRDDLAAINQKTDAAYAEMTSKLEQAQSGSLPLTPAQQAQIDSIKQAFERAKGEQMIANKNYEGGITLSGIASGRNRYAPEIAQGQIKAAVDQGIAKINEIDSKMNQAVAQMTSAFQEDNIDMIKSSYETFMNFQAQRQNQIDKMHDNVQKFEQTQIENARAARKEAADAEQRSFDNTLKSMQFSADQKKDAFEQAMASDKFSWQQKQDMQDNYFKQADMDLKYQEMDMKQQEFSWKQLAEQAKLNPGGPETVDALNDKLRDIDTLLNHKGMDSRVGPNPLARVPWTDDFTGKGQDFAGRVHQLVAKDTIDTLLALKSAGGTLGALSDQERLMLQNAATKISDWEVKNDQGVGQGRWNIDEQSFKTELGVLRDLTNRALTNARGYDAPLETLQSYYNSSAANAAKVDQILADNPDLSAEDVSQILGLSFKREGGGSKTPKRHLGSLSAPYESGGDPGRVSTGIGDAGGVSYGTYQLTTNNVKKFAQQSRYADAFAGLKSGTPAFSNQWKAIAKKDPQGFAEEQQKYIERTHYDPQIKKLASAGIDVDRYSPVLKDVIFSTSVQHGPATNIVAKAIKKVGPNAPEDEIIKAIYNERWAGGANFQSSSKAMRDGVYKRFFGPNGEMATALKQVNSNMA